MPDPVQDQLSPEDAQALIHAQQQLYAAGDQRAGKLYNYIVQSGYAKRGSQGELLPMDTMGAAPTFGDKLKSMVTHPLNALESASQPVSRPAGASMGEMLATDAHNVGAGATSVVRHPLNTLGGMVAGPVKAVTDPAGTFQALNEGGPEAGAQMLGQSLATAGIAKAVAPAAAAAVPKVAEAGTALASKAQTVGSKLVPALIDGPPESLITRAVKPGKNNVGWATDVQKAVPLMKSAEQQLGRPVAGIDDALEAAGIAKKGIWQQYQARLGPAAAQSATIDGNAIADAMVNRIDKRTALQNPELVARVKATADTYRHPMALEDAEDFLRSANADLNSYYAKNKVSRQVAENDPEVSSTLAEADALRSGLYSKLDELSGPGAAQLKKAYGSISNVEKELYGRKLVADRQMPESLSEQLSTARGAGKIAKGVVTLSPGDVLEGVESIAVSRALKARNTSDAMIARAFQAAKPAQPFPMPSFRPSMPTTRQLPATSTAPTILPYYPEMSGGERLAALMQMLRQRQQMALPAKASAIPLPPSF